MVCIVLTAGRSSGLKTQPTGHSLAGRQDVADEIGKNLQQYAGRVCARNGSLERPQMITSGHALGFVPIAALAWARINQPLGCSRRGLAVMATGFVPLEQR